MIKVYQLSFPEETSGHKYKIWSPYARRACLETRDARGQQRRGAPRASQKGAGDGVAPGSNHPRAVPRRSQGCDCHAVEVCNRQPRLGECSSPYPKGKGTHRQRSGVITNTPPKRTRAFLSKS